MNRRNLNEDLVAEASKSEELEAKLSEETEARTKALAEDLIQSMEQKSQSRKNGGLIEAGLSEEEAAAKIDIFDGLS